MVRDLTAQDLDSADQLTYYIISGNDHGNFTINVTSGEILVDSDLDREFQSVITLTVEVTDGAQNVSNITVIQAYAVSRDVPLLLQDTTMVQITLQDVNDNPPVFLEQYYTTNITENIYTGAPVLVVSEYVNTSLS